MSIMIATKRILVVSLCLLSICASSGRTEEKSKSDEAPKFTKGFIIRFEKEITYWREKYLYRKLEIARRQGADLLVIEIESPGGMLEPSENIAERLLEIDWAHTVAYIPSEAYSGAAMASLGCDEIVMAPNAKIGDVGVISLTQSLMWQYAEEKIRSPVIRHMRDLAEAQGRSPALAEAMVDMDLVVYRVRNNSTNEILYMSEEEIESSENADELEKLEPVLESREKQFLTLNGRRAVELGIAQANLSSRQELREHYKLDSDFVVLRHTGTDTAVTILNLPLVTGLLFVVGLVALYIELSAPGISVGGLISGLCFALFFWSRFLGGTSGWLEVVLFLAGIVFIAMELFVIPGFGISGVTGLLLVLASLVMASQDFTNWNAARSLPSLTSTLAVILGSGLVSIVIMAVLSRYLGSVPVLNRLVLAPPPTEEAGQDEPMIDEKGKAYYATDHFSVDIGDWGVADSPLRPAGKVKFGNEFVDVVTDGSFVDQGDRVRVIDISGNRVMVRKVEQPV